MTTHYKTLHDKNKMLRSRLDCAKGDFHRQKKMFDELLIKAAAMANALAKIATPHSCGCVPCHGDCRLADGELISEFQDIAAEALKAAGVTE